MTKYNINKYIAIAGILWIALSVACSKMDDYKDYVKDGEISYTGKIDSLKIYSGNKRVLVEGLFLSDPKITKCVIYWNSRKDSAVIDVDRSKGVDTLHYFISDLQDNVYNFEIRTYDKLGNASVPVYSVGTVYGDRYQASLNNRPISKNELFAGDLTTTLIFGSMDRTSGVFATEVDYKDQNNDERRLYLPIDSVNMTLPGYAIGSEFKYRTMFIPDTSCIDTFYTTYSSAAPAIVYLRNLGGPFNHGNWDGGRWGVLADWITNADTKNAGGDKYGGYELRGGKGVLSFEAGWGLRAVPNGKIYQQTTLPAGDYTFQPIGIERGAEGVIYAAVSEGTELPDFANVTTQAIASEVIGTTADKLQFHLNQTTTVAIGFVANMPDVGSYFKVQRVEFEKIE